MIRPFGERALLVETDGPAVAQALASSIAAEPIPGVEAAVPALASVLVELEPWAADRAGEVGEVLARRLAGTLVPPPAGRVRTIPVVYGGEHGPDIEGAAEACRMTADELAARHAATEVRVLFCGFAPGYAYLGDLPEALHVSRLRTPRTRTPAGSVAIAGPMTGIYPADLPGGWRVIGRTPLLLFDARRVPPAYLAPGDSVRWQSIEPGDWPPGRPTAATDW